MKFLIPVFCLLSFPAFPAAAGTDAYADLAQKLCGQPVKGVKKIAVLPFASVESTGTTRDGLVMAERLTAALAACKKVKPADFAKVKQALAGTGFLPERDPGPELRNRLDDELGADAVITGLFTDIGGGRLELRARLLRLSDSSAVSKAMAVLVRDWAGYAPVTQPAVGPREGLRAAIRDLAAKGVPVKESADWQEFSAGMAATLLARERAAGLGGKDRLLNEELNAWRSSPEEKIMLARAPAFNRANYSDGFTLVLDEAASVTDCSYPAWKVRRAAMRARALLFRPRGARSLPEWGPFLKELSSERATAGSSAEADKWKFGAGEKYLAAEESCEGRPAYCEGLGIKSGKVTRAAFEDGFMLVLDGGRPADCYYPPVEVKK